MLSKNEQRVIKELIEPLIKLGEFNLENLPKKEKTIYLLKLLYENMRKKAVYIGGLESELQHFEIEIKKRRRRINHLEEKNRKYKEMIEELKAVNRTLLKKKSCQ